MIHYGGRLFRVVSSTEASQTNGGTIFKYTQIENRVMAEYAGGSILFGHLLGRVDAEGVIDMRYHHIDQAGTLRTGTCLTTPEVLDGGKLRLHERWRWTCGDGSSGESILEEL